MLSVLADYIPSTTIGDIIVSLAVLAGAVGSAYSIVSAKRSKVVLRTSEAVNRAVNNVPEGQPSIYALTAENASDIKDLKRKYTYLMEDVRFIKNFLLQAGVIDNDRGA